MKKPRRIREVRCPHCTHAQRAQRKKPSEDCHIQYCNVCFMFFSLGYTESWLVEAPVEEEL